MTQDNNAPRLLMQWTTQPLRSCSVTKPKLSRRKYSWRPQNRMVSSLTPFDFAKVLGPASSFQRSWALTHLSNLPQKYWHARARSAFMTFMTPWNTILVSIYPKLLFFQKAWPTEPNRTCCLRNVGPNGAVLLSNDVAS